MSEQMVRRWHTERAGISCDPVGLAKSPAAGDEVFVSSGRPLTHLGCGVFKKGFLDRGRFAIGLAGMPSLSSPGLVASRISQAQATFWAFSSFGLLSVRLHKFPPCSRCMLHARHLGQAEDSLREATEAQGLQHPDYWERAFRAAVAWQLEVGEKLGRLCFTTRPSFALRRNAERRRAGRVRAKDAALGAARDPHA